MIATIKRDDAMSLKEKLDHGDSFYFVETLPAEAYHTRTFPRLSMPPDRIRELAPALLPDKSAEIVVYCSKPS